MFETDLHNELGARAGAGIEEPTNERWTMDWEGFFTQYRKPGFIPGYEIVNKLGSGVFGEVYKARKESIGKFYAIKFLKVSDEKVSEAIFKELDTLRYFAQIDHPNLVSIEDKGEVMGIPYIVMGYAGDETLKKRLAGGPLEGIELREVFRQLCCGVAALHEKSIIHFDLKPANVFMKDNHARVGDYGLSKLVSESANTMSIGRGTPYYMAPEMLRRKGDHRSDIYSMGVILFEMVTGDVPFTGDSEWEVLKKHETQQISVPATVPDPYRGIIMRAMAKRPEERFQSVPEILAMFDSTAATTGSVPVPAAAALGSLPPPPPRGNPVPPPLPSARFLDGGKPTEAVRHLRHNLNEVVARIRQAGGAAAVRAKEAYAEQMRILGGKARNAGQAALDSFYADFDDAAAAGAAVSAPATAEPGAGAASADDAPKKRGFFYILFWPLLMLFKGIGKVFSGIGKLIAVFFTNFLRYAVVLAITFGLAFLAFAAVRGFNL